MAVERRTRLMERELKGHGRQETPYRAAGQATPLAAQIGLACWP
jgi:hypothetical protein